MRAPEPQRTAQQQTPVEEPSVLHTALPISIIMRPLPFQKISISVPDLSNVEYVDWSVLALWSADFIAQICSLHIVALM